MAVAGADFGQSFRRLKAATAAAADVMAPEQGALRAGEFFQQHRPKLLAIEQQRRGEFHGVTAGHIFELGEK